MLSKRKSFLQCWKEVEKGGKVAMIKIKLEIETA